MPTSSQPADLGELHLIFLPGLHGTAELFDTLVTKLTTQAKLKLANVSFHSTLINYPPTLEQSYKKLFKWLSSHLKFDLPDSNTNTVIIAESFSTPLALQLADQFPEKIKAVIIGGGFCASPVNPGFALLPLRPLLMIAPPCSAVRHFLTGSQTPPELTHKVRSEIKKASSKILNQRIRSILTLEEHHTPTLTKTPVLLLQAEHDAIIPWEMQNQLEQHLSHAEIHWLDSPHLIFQAQPEICASHIVDFFAKLTS